MTAETIAPEWMHRRITSDRQITSEQCDSWSEEQCAGIEAVDKMVVVSPSASKRHDRLARLLANALDAAGGEEWNADARALIGRRRAGRAFDRVGGPA